MSLIFLTTSKLTPRTTHILVQLTLFLGKSQQLKVQSLRINIQENWDEHGKQKSQAMIAETFQNHLHHTLQRKYEIIA